MKYFFWGEAVTYFPVNRIVYLELVWVIIGRGERI